MCDRVQDKKEFHYLEAIRLYPIYVSAYINLGALYSKRGDYEMAIQVRLLSYFSCVPLLLL